MMHKETLRDSEVIATVADSRTGLVPALSRRLEELARLIDAAILAGLADPSLSRMVVARQLSVSPRQISRALASAGGFRSRVRALRVRRAAEMLVADTTIPVKVVAYTTRSA